MCNSGSKNYWYLERGWIKRIQSQLYRKYMCKGYQSNIIVLSTFKKKESFTFLMPRSCIIRSVTWLMFTDDGTPQYFQKSNCRKWMEEKVTAPPAVRQVAAGTSNSSRVKPYVLCLCCSAKSDLSSSQLRIIYQLHLFLTSIFFFIERISADVLLYCAISKKNKYKC